VAFVSNNYFPKPVSAILGKEARQNAAKQVRQRKKVRILSHIPPNPTKVYRNRHRVRNGQL
jgi:hypothetical protein